MTIAGLSNIAMTTAKEQKEVVVRREGVGTDIVPLLMFVHDGVVTGAIVMDGSPYKYLEPAVALTDAEAVVMVTECWFYRDDSAATPEERDRHWADKRPSQRFAEGDPNAFEALLVVTWDSTGHGTLQQAPYRYDGRRIEWLEPGSDPIANADGDMYDAVRAGFAARAERPVPAVPLDIVASLLHTTAFEVHFVRPTRNDPCPCGSGKKAKACCWH